MENLAERNFSPVKQSPKRVRPVEPIEEPPVKQSIKHPAAINLTYVFVQKKDGLEAIKTGESTPYISSKDDSRQNTSETHPKGHIVGAVRLDFLVLYLSIHWASIVI